MQRIGGIRRRSRYRLKKGYRDKGKISLRRYFQTYKTGDRVALDADSSVQKGLYHIRFHGKIGEVVGQAGASYKVSIQDQGKKKILLVHPIHLRRL